MAKRAARFGLLCALGAAAIYVAVCGALGIDAMLELEHVFLLWCYNA